MRRFGSGEDAFDAGEHLCGFEDFGLFDGDGTHHFLIVEFGEDGAHAVIAQAAGVNRAGHEAGTERVHFGEWADFARIAEVVGVDAACEGGTAGGFDGHDVVVGFAAQFFAHERGNEAAQIGSAACTADDHVRLDAVFVERGFRFEADDGLVQENLVKNRAEDVAISFMFDGVFDGFGNGATEAAAGAGEVCEDFFADVGRVGRRRDDFGTVGAHDFTTERFLFVANLDHINNQVEIEISTCHGERRAPLTCTGFGRNALEALFFGVVCLGNGGIELVRSARVVAFEFVIDMCGSAEFFFETIGADERGRTIHLVKVADVVWNWEFAGVVVEFLLDEVSAENGFEFFGFHRLTGSGIDEGRRFFLHVGADVVPGFGKLVFAEVNLVGDFKGRCHVCTPDKEMMIGGLPLTYDYLFGMAILEYSGLGKKKAQLHDRITGHKTRF